MYNHAVPDPAELNKYQPFTAEVYGETSFELTNLIIDSVSPISNQISFIDLGSGVGQVVLQVLSDFLNQGVKMPLVQVAALTECHQCVGIEKAKIPSEMAVTMDKLFRLWMAW